MVFIPLASSLPGQHRWAVSLNSRSQLLFVYSPSPDSNRFSGSLYLNRTRRINDSNVTNYIVICNAQTCVNTIDPYYNLLKYPFKCDFPPLLGP